MADRIVLGSDHAGLALRAEAAKVARAAGFEVAFVGDVVGTGSSRKSACNSVQWAIGEDIPFVPNKRRGGVIIGGVIAPIFFNTAQDSGALPIKADVSKLKMGDVVNKGDVLLTTQDGIVQLGAVDHPAQAAEAKKLIAAVADRPIDQELITDTAVRIAERRSSAEGRNGLSAFLQKGLPRWVKA